VEFRERVKGKENKRASTILQHMRWECREYKDVY
jgi:hypothetical protein